MSDEKCCRLSTKLYLLSVLVLFIGCYVLVGYSNDLKNGMNELRATIITTESTVGFNKTTLDIMRYEERLEMIQSYIDFQEQAKKERLETIQSFIDSHEQVQNQELNNIHSFIESHKQVESSQSVNESLTE